METKKKYFMDCHLAGRKYHDVDAVAVIYHNEDNGEDYCIGYLPREENGTIASLLEMGWVDIFECRISKITPDAHPEKQIYLTIKIKRNKQA